MASAADTPCERQPERAQRNELDGRLEEAAKAGSAEAVLALIDQEGEHFTEQNVATALAAVAEACSATAQAKGKGGKRRGRPPSRARSAPLSPQDIVRSSAFQALVDMVLAGMMRLEPRLLAEAVRSCGQLGASEEMLLDEIGRHVMGRVHHLTATDIAGLVEGFAALDHSPSLVLFDSLAARAALVAGEFTPEQRAAVQAGYERLGYGAKAPAL